MSRLLSITLLLLLSITASAAAQVTQVDERRENSISQAAISVSSLSQTFKPTQTTQQPVFNVSGQRRRGSMVGYIEDAVVGSKVRVRFDIGLHNRAPDRAEFFYAKCGCYRDLSLNDPARDPDAAGPGPGIADDLNFQEFYIVGEYAANERISAFAELPLRWLQPQTAGTFADQSGMVDLRAGVKLALAATPDMTLTAQVKTFLPTGDSRRGLGTDHASIEPGLLYHHQLTDRAALASQFTLWIPFGGANGVPTSVDDKFAGNVLSYGIGPSFDVFSNENVRFSPVVELVGWRVLSGYQTAARADASGTNIVNLKFGARTSWGPGSSIYAGYGRALTDAVWYDEIVRFEYRFSF